MNALGISYLVLAGVALVLACVHLAQAVVIRSDRTQLLLAVVCLGFGLFDLSIAFSSEHTGSLQPTWPGWHLLAAASAALLTLTVPMVAWLVLELKLNTARWAVIGITAGLGLARIAGVSLLVTAGAPVTWEYLHSLDHVWLAIPSVLCAVVGGGSWAVEGALAWRRGVRYAFPMMAFGCVATLASLHGVGVTLGLIPPPDSFGLLALPAVAFIQVLSSVRFVQALQAANQPAGEISRYEVLSRLGGGGMGEIFLARRKGPAGFLREVVLKTLRASDDPRGKERFLAEGRLAAQLRHPNIVDVYDLGEQPSGFFIVMEHISGATFRQILERSIELSRPVPPEVVAELGVQTCRALSFAHSAHVLHRDIKRENVMVSFTGVVKLIDFGIAQQLAPALEQRETALQSAPSVVGGGLTAADGVIGTLGYIAPERYAGDPASVASDLFAVGVVLYELLALRSPFKADSAAAFLEAVSSRRAPRLELARSDIPPALSSAIEQCLEPSPGSRPPSAASLQAMFEHALQGRRIELSGWARHLFPAGAPPPRDPRSAPTTPVHRSEVPTSPLRRSGS